MLEDYESIIEDKKRFKHVDILKEYIKSKGTGSSDKKNTCYSVRSFYAFHRLPLPRILKNESSRLFKPSKHDKLRSLESSPLKLEEVKKLILNASQPYKAAFTVIFQSAMGLAEFTQFNIEGWMRVIKRISDAGPILINLYREKTSRARVEDYYTFVGDDGKSQIQDWLDMRPDSDVDALFVVYNKNRREWVPLRGRLVGDMVTKVARRIGLIQTNEFKRYHVHAHEFRDLFKSLCTLNGVNPIASEFFLGHRIDKLGYDKSPEYNVEWFRREYRKVEPQLNIISGIENREDIKKEFALEAIQRFAETFGIDPLKVRIEKQKELGRELNNEEEIQMLQNEIKKIRNKDSNPQIVIKEEELENYLSDGWQFVSILPSNKILIRK